MDVIFRFCMAHIYNNHNVIETVNNCMPVGSFSIFHGMVDQDVPHRNEWLILKSDNHFPVNFYFTVLSEPSQDSSLGQFLFYRPVGTVTGLI